ncbi:10518_t:CDS:2 [Dentiscutata erythropus]|uniref:10518_t:CDS:1 n=1 Tax=Dentiscutata erythropus TaxID=1348616 RepID=A0A9N8V8Q9_9GLOM|nr:10518_t:CDS:2 [Dentiscutata erythropus]
METTNPKLNQAILIDAERIFTPNGGPEFLQDNLYNNTDKPIDIAAIKDQLKSSELDIDPTEQIDTEPNQDGRKVTPSYKQILMNTTYANDSYVELETKWSKVMIKFTHSKQEECCNAYTWDNKAISEATHKLESFEKFLCHKYTTILTESEIPHTIKIKIKHIDKFFFYTFTQNHKAKPAHHKKKTSTRPQKLTLKNNIHFPNQHVNSTEKPNLPQDYKEIEGFKIIISITFIEQVADIARRLKTKYYFYRIPENWIKIKETHSNSPHNINNLPNTIEELKAEVRKKQLELINIIPIVRH